MPQSSDHSVRETLLYYATAATTSSSALDRTLDTLSLPAIVYANPPAVDWAIVISKTQPESAVL